VVTDDLVQQLLDTGYDNLFHRLDHDALDAVWDNGARRERLRQVARDETVPLTARFLASEVLFNRDPGYPPPADRARLAAVYVSLLASDELMGNAWGLPGEMSGEVGQHLLALGEPAIALLQPLLSDPTVVWFEGSEEATTGNAYQLRVMDLAAAFIRQLRGQPVSLALDPKSRDAMIADLRASLI